MFSIPFLFPFAKNYIYLCKWWGNIPFQQVSKQTSKYKKMKLGVALKGNNDYNIYIFIQYHLLLCIWLYMSLFLICKCFVTSVLYI